MENSDKLILTQNDFQKITSLIKVSDSEIAELLEQEMDRATVVADDELPIDVVSMNSKVTFKDMDTNKESLATLVYPQDAKIEEGKISILAPIGAALIGLRVGQFIEWPMPSGKSKRLIVVSVENKN